MHFPPKKYITDFYDTSVVMVLYGDYDAFKNIFRHNHVFFTGNGIEVILIIADDVWNTALLNFINDYPYINWKIVLNRGDTDANANNYLNIGLANASHRYLLIIDPHSTLVNDVVYQLRYMLYHYPESFVMGQGLVTGTFEEDTVNGNKQSNECLVVGSFMADKSELFRIGGFDDQIGDQLDIISTCSRLEMLGQKKMLLIEAITYHSYNSCSYFKHTWRRIDELPIILQQRILYPKRAFFKRNEDYTYQISFDWQKDKINNARQLVLKKFQQVYIRDAQAFEKQYGVICLMQVRNEKRNMPDVLIHLDQYCDGIILLDDESEDSTYENALSKKLLLKVQKKYNGYFNDLENRNLLLQLGYLFHCQWFFFMDADERFDPRYTNLYSLVQLAGIDVITFRLVHLWNKTDQYRKNIPEGKNGILRRYRMFRSKGYLQIKTNRDIHFKATPFKKISYNSNVLILHYGLIEKLTREKKYDAYIQQDIAGIKQGYPYDYLLDENVQLGYCKQI